MTSHNPNPNDAGMHAVDAGNVPGNAAAPSGTPAGAPTTAAAAQKQQGNAWKTVREYLPWIVVPIVIVALLRLFVFDMYEIPSSSMENTLKVGDRVMVVKPTLAKPERGDIITFKDPGGWLHDNATKHSNILIKRLIGMPGDTVACKGAGSAVTVNGVALDESSYLKDGEWPSMEAFSVTVPEGRVFVMGDNRSNSADSRYHMDADNPTGTVPMENITGVSKLIYWPISHWTMTD